LLHGRKVYDECDDQLVSAGCFRSYFQAMSARPGPVTPKASTWSDIEPLYAELRDRPLGTGNLRGWLDDFSRLDEAVDEAFSLVMIDYTADTRNEGYEQTYRRWASETLPQLHEIRVSLARRLLDFADDLPDLSLFIRELRTDVEIFRSENLPRMAALEEMEATYDKITGGLTVEWDGETKTVPELQPYLLDPDRRVRERAFRLAADAYMDKRDEIAALFHQMVATRDALAKEAGFANFRDYSFAAKYRFDYSPDDCLRFHEAVEASVLPAILRLHEHRRRQLGLDALKPWDLQVQPGASSRLTPFSTTPEFLAGTKRIFDTIDPELGGFFRQMIDHQLLDLESRQGKAPGGYCTRLPQRGEPFIFMNAVGVHDDVNTLVHESGHAFHTFLTRDIKYIWQRATGHEASELASMSMELLAAPHVQKPIGFYSASDAAIAQIDHLEDILLGLAHIACVDAFQHWIYTDGIGASPDDRDRKWLEIRARFEQGVDYTGLDAERVARWYRQSHIHTVPFYYIEYGLAQIGALQVWRRSRRDPVDALAKYKAALALGGTRTLPQIFATAGASLVFDARTMKELVAEVETRIDELRDEARQQAA
jgi:oligoendopeptidase F